MPRRLMAPWTALLLAVGCDATKPEDTGPTCVPAEEVPYDGLDQDCDGQDLVDVDGDGFVAVQAGGEDCDDRDREVHPDAQESCDGIDNDCDGVIDEIAPTWYTDADGDAWGDPAAELQACDQPEGTSARAEDCDDGDAAIHPNADEHCDGVDEDCDGEADEDAVDTPLWAVDEDGDGYGDGTQLMIASCTPISGRVANHGDCDDADPEVHAGAIEVCDGIDNDCDGLVDGEQGDCPLEGIIPATEAAARILGHLYEDAVGSTLAPAGDLDGDGRDDFVLGVPYDGFLDYGAAYVFLGPVNAELEIDDADAIFRGSALRGYAGDAVAAGEDLDGDGVADIAVGAPWHDGGGSYGGAVSVVSGDLRGEYILETDGTTLYGERDTRLGSTVALLHRAGPRGEPGLLASAPAGGEDADSGGAVFLFRAPLPVAAAVSDADAALLGPGEGWAGYALASAGDLNGDGFTDSLIGDWDGQVYLVHGPLGGVTELASGADATLRTAPGSSERITLAGASDVDGDGLDDFLLGAPWTSTTLMGAGGVYLFTSAPEGEHLRDEADGIVLGAYVYGMLGTSVSLVRDLDGDGRAEVLAGAPGVDCPWPDAGAAYLFAGPVEGLISALDAQAQLCGEHSSDALGSGVADAGDVDGDGTTDLLAGAPGQDDGFQEAGAAYLLHGLVTPGAW